MERTSLSVASLQKRTVAFVIDDIVISLFFLVIFYDQITAFLGSIPLEQQSDTQMILEQMNQFVIANILPLFACGFASPFFNLQCPFINPVGTLPPLVTLYGGSVTTQSTLPLGISFISSKQSPNNISFLPSLILIKILFCVSI